MKKDDVELVSLAEIAAMLGVQVQTVYRWRWRKGAMPEPDWEFSGTPVWLGDTIRDWALATGRMDAEGRPVKKKAGWVTLPDGSKARQVSS